MPTYTEHFNFAKPRLTDGPPNIEVVTDNFDPIDSLLYEHDVIIKDFTYYQDTYGYSFTNVIGEDGSTTITVTLDDTSPVEGTMTVVITEAENGDTTIDVTTVIDGVTSKSSHTINDAGGEGGVVNG